MLAPIGSLDISFVLLDVSVVYFSIIKPNFFSDHGGGAWTQTLLNFSWTLYFYASIAVGEDAEMLSDRRISLLLG
jgi:hypothetical protein